MLGHTRTPIQRRSLLLGDKLFDSNPLHAVAHRRGVQMIAPRQKLGTSVSQQAHHPNRLESIRTTEGADRTLWERVGLRQDQTGEVPWNVPEHFLLAPEGVPVPLQSPIREPLQMPPRTRPREPDQLAMAHNQSQHKVAQHHQQQRCNWNCDKSKSKQYDAEQ